MTIRTGKPFILIAMVAVSTSASPAHGTPTEPANLRGLTPSQKAHVVLGEIPNIRFASSMPSNFPLPTYTNNVTQTNFSSNTRGRPTAAAAVITTDPADRVCSWYKDALGKAGWQVQTPNFDALCKMGKQGRLFMLKANKANQEVYIYCLPRARGGTISSITWEMKK
jgi:hypothetical protein